MELNNVVKAAIFSALAVGLGFAFIFVPNIEFISVIVFISGLTLGLKWGIVVGASSMFIYSSMNPLGSGLVFPPLLLGQVLSMGVIGALGAGSKHIFNANSSVQFHIIFSGFCGLSCALIYDISTSVSYPLSVGYGYKQTLGYVVSGLLFTFVHQLSSVIIFLIVVPKYLKISS